MDRTFTRRVLVALAPVAPLALSPLGAPGVRAMLQSPVAGLEDIELTELLEELVSQGLTGVALQIDRGDQTLYSGAAGVASIKEQTPLKANDRFPIYSIAKTFTATVALQLVDEGVLSLDDTVATWLDDPVVARIPHTDDMTLYQLLNHTSGVYDYADEDSPFWQDAFFGPAADPTRDWTPQELLAYADGTSHDPYFAPGEGYHYANTDYVLVGLMIEAATGNRLAEEIRTRIVDPLGLADTYLVGDDSATDSHVHGYQLIDGQLVDVSSVNLSWAWAAGGMVSTTQDLAQFARAVFRGELLSPDSFEAMFSYVPGAKSGQEAGLGVYTNQTANGRLVGMDGSGAGFNSSMMRLPEADLTVILLVNKSPDEGEPDTIRDAAFAWAIAQESGTPTA